jgi:SnoaL-like domain
MEYFELATRDDTESYFAQFTDDAVVEDEGKEHHGIPAIRAWRREIPRVRYDVQDLDRNGSDTLAHVAVSGDFPGSPVTLTFHFGYAEDGRISTLRIRG